MHVVRVRASGARVYPYPWNGERLCVQLYRRNREASETRTSERVTDAKTEWKMEKETTTASPIFLDKPAPSMGLFV